MLSPTDVAGWRLFSTAGALVMALFANDPAHLTGSLEPVSAGWRSAMGDVAGAALVVALFPLLVGRRRGAAARR